MAPERSQQHGTFTRFRDGTWGVRMTGPRPALGSTVRVDKKDGSVKAETVEAVLWSGADQVTGEPVHLVRVRLDAPKGATRGKPLPRTAGTPFRRATEGLAILAAALLAMGCAPGGGSSARVSAGPTRALMVIQPGLTPYQEERCRDAWAFYLARFEAENGPLVGGWRSLTVIPGSEVAPGVGGIVRPGRHVALAEDAEQVLTAAYHELCHLRLMDEGTDGDPQHLDPRWVGWQARRQAAVFALIDDRIARFGRSH